MKSAGNRNDPVAGMSHSPRDPNQMISGHCSTGRCLRRKFVAYEALYRSVVDVKAHSPWCLSWHVASGRGAREPGQRMGRR